MSDHLFDEMKAKLDTAMDVYQRDLNSIRTGRASAHLLDSVVVEAYGKKVPINQAASISIIDSKVISVQVWDKEVVKNAIKAIENSIAVNPIAEGQSLKIVLPDITEERRKELCKQASKHLENIKISSRNIRRDVIDKLKKMEKEKEINEDELKRFSDKVQKIIDDFTKKCEIKLLEKEKEIMKV